MPRRKSIREKKDNVKAKGPYNKKDNTILKVASYLVSKGEEGATIYNIISAKSKIGLSTQDQTRFTKKIMIPMENDGWVTKREYSAKVQVYVITGKGQSAVADALNLRKDDSLLSTLEAFRDLVQ